MLDARQQTTVEKVASILTQRGHRTCMIYNQLNTVDGVWVGVCILPRKEGKAKKNAFYARIGFSELYDEYPNAFDADPEKLADWVLAWKDQNAEASLARSRTEVPVTDAEEFI